LNLTLTIHHYSSTLELHTAHTAYLTPTALTELLRRDDDGCGGVVVYFSLKRTPGGDDDDNGSANTGATTPSSGGGGGGSSSGSGGSGGSGNSSKKKGERDYDNDWSQTGVCFVDTRALRRPGKCIDFAVVSFFYCLCLLFTTTTGARRACVS
jgi:hypothetical protein